MTPYEEDSDDQIITQSTETINKLQEISENYEYKTLRSKQPPGKDTM
jgi:hypothetical protein